MASVYQGGKLNNVPWVQKWSEHITYCTLDKPNPRLVSNFHWLDDLNDDKRIFITLCGKTLDMVWCRDKGYTVYGVEIAPAALEWFFDEQKIKYDIINHGLFNLYQSSDSKLRLFQGNYLNVTPKLFGEKFTKVFDRGGFEITLRQDDPSVPRRYVEILASVVAPGGRVLLAEVWTEQLLRGKPVADPEKGKEEALQFVKDAFSPYFDVQLVEVATPQSGYSFGITSPTFETSLIDLTFVATRNP